MSTLFEAAVAGDNATWFENPVGAVLRSKISKVQCTPVIEIGTRVKFNYLHTPSMKFVVYFRGLGHAFI